MFSELKLHLRWFGFVQNIKKRSAVVFEFSAELFELSIPPHFSGTFFSFCHIIFCTALLLKTQILLVECWVTAQCAAHCPHDSLLWLDVD